MTRDEVLKAALALSHDDQAVILDRLIESMAQPPSEDVEKAWLAEFERRIAAYDRGEIELIDAEEVLNRHRGRKSA